MNAQPHTQASAALVLGLCPVLAVGDSVLNAIGIGVAAILALTLSSLITLAVARLVPAEIRLAACVLIVSAVVGWLMLSFSAAVHELHRSLGIYLPLLISNYVLLERTTAAAGGLPAEFPGLTPESTHTSGGMVRTLKTGFTLAAALLLLGIAREIVGRGSLLYNAGALFGDAAGRLRVQLFNADMGFLLATFPPGAFISVGLLLAARNWWLSRRRPPHA